MEVVKLSANQSTARTHSELLIGLEFQGSREVLKNKFRINRMEPLLRWVTDTSRAVIPCKHNGPFG